MGTKNTPIGAETAKLAGLQIDELQKLRDNQLTLEQIEWWNNLSRETRERYMQSDFLDVTRGLASIVRHSFKLALDKVFNPTEFIGDGWSIWLGPADGDGLEGDEDYLLEPDVVDFEQLVLETHLKGEETSILGEEKMKRARASKNRQLGGKTFLALWLNWQECKAAGKPEDSILECLCRGGKIGKVIYFFGLTLRDPLGNRRVLCLCLFGGAWRWGYNWLGNQWDAGIPSVSLASVEAQS